MNLNAALTWLGLVVVVVVVVAQAIVSGMHQIVEQAIWDMLRQGFA